MKINSLASILICICFISSCGIKKYSKTMEQLSTTEIINVKFTEKQISEDIDYFIKSVEEVSPFPYKCRFTHNSSLNERVKAKR